jgi:cytochrome c oxidase assembly factor CtaG
VTAAGAPSVAQLLGQWHAGVVLPVLGAAAAAYLAGAARASRWPWWRVGAWLAGLAALALALASGVDSEADRLLSVHMVQHVLLSLVAPPLLLLGAPARLALRAGGPGTRRRVAALMRERGVAVLAHPLVAWVLFTGVLVVTHLTGLYELALRHDAVHAAEHAGLFWSAMLFWLPLAGAAPVPHRLGPIGMLAYLMTSMAGMAVVAVALGTDGLRYSSYAAPARAMGISAIGDQHLAAGIMVGAGAIATLTATFAVLWPALLREERHAQARERLRTAHAGRGPA